jgi:hypothetical protein
VMAVRQSLQALTVKDYSSLVSHSVLTSAGPTVSRVQRSHLNWQRQRNGECFVDTRHLFRSDCAGASL